MIQPSSLWSLFKNCNDSEWIGKVCRALGGQEVDLDFGQKMMLSQLKQDSEWMDERIAEQRERWRSKKQMNKKNEENSELLVEKCDSQRNLENSKVLGESCGSQGKVENSELLMEKCDSRFSPSLPSSLPSSLTSFLPNNIYIKERNIKERKKFTPPTRQEAVSYCELKGLPSSNVDNFIDYYTSNGWKVGRNPMVNWRSALSGWIRRARNNGKQPQYHEQGYSERNGSGDFEVQQ